MTVGDYWLLPIGLERQESVGPGDILAASAYIYELGTSGSIHTGA